MGPRQSQRDATAPAPPPLRPAVEQEEDQLRLSNRKRAPPPLPRLINANGRSRHHAGVVTSPTTLASTTNTPPTSLRSPRLPRAGQKFTNKPLASGKRNVQRSASTPHMRDDAAMSDSDGEKKRNKLGYQRISIACAHCRRRKIRCLVADNDSESRCQNCIRLKKECVFYPVDQQNAMDKMDASSKSSAQSTTSSVVSNSPPHLSPNGTYDTQRPPYNGFPAQSGYHGIPIPLHASLPEQEFSYVSAPEMQAPWNHGQYNACVTLAGPDEILDTPNRYADPVLSSNGSHYGQPFSPSAMHHRSSLTDSYGYAMHDNDTRWPPVTHNPTRSYSHPEVYTDAASLDTTYRTSQTPFSAAYHTEYPTPTMDAPPYLPLPTHNAKTEPYHHPHMNSLPLADSFNAPLSYALPYDPRQPAMTLPSQPAARTSPTTWLSSYPSPYSSAGEARAMTSGDEAEKFLVSSQAPG